MIVNAASRFGCRHRYVVTDEDGAMLFVCECCGHRTDQLPVHLTTARGQIVQFPSAFVSAPPAVPAVAPAARTSRSTQHRG